MSNLADSIDLDLHDAAGSKTGLSLLQVAWQRKSLVILGVLLGLVLGLLYYAQKAPTYQSQAQMLVVRKTSGSEISLSPGGDSRVGYVEDYMSTQAIVIRSPEIVSRALKLPNLANLQSFAGDPSNDVVSLVRENLIAGRDNRDAVSGATNNILALTFRGPIAEECPKILNAVIDSYKNFLNETYKNVSDRTLDLIVQAKDTLSSQVDQKEEGYKEFRLKNPFLLFRTSNGNANMFQERLARTEAKRAELRMEKAELEEKLAQIEKTNKEYGPAAAMVKVAASNLKINLLDGVNDADKQIMQLELKKKQLRSNVGPNHPSIKEIDEQITLLRTIANKGVGAVTMDTTSGPDKKPVRELSTLEQVLQITRERIESCDTMIRMLDALFTNDQAQARELANYEAQDERFRSGISSARQLYESIVKRLNEINLVKEFGGYDAQILAQPVLGKKVSPNPFSVFPVAAFSGLLAGLCLAYLAELSDKSFRTPAEIRKRLGVPVIGHIPFFTADEKASKAIAAGENVMDPMLCTHYSSNSISAEAYRAVRTALYFNTHGVGHQVIQVTSPNMADGKSTLAANLAISIAQSGKKTIIIDADCRKPRVHKMLALPNDSGVASVIAGKSDLASSIKPTSVPNLSALPCGPRPANPAELLTSPRFKELLDIIRAQFDYVIVDTPPLLLVTDPCVVAPRVDGVVVAMRITKNGRPFAERAKEILNSLGANILGVVVNGLGSQASGRYGGAYDSYNYGYSYKYSYTYKDDYTDGYNSSYYTAPDNPDVMPEPKGDQQAPPSSPT